jgi:hypothetical protein
MNALDHTEAAFETLIVSAMTADGRWVGGDPKDYDPHLGLYPADAVDFIVATQPKKSAKLVSIAGGGAKARYALLKRLAGQLDKQGSVEVLRTASPSAASPSASASYVRRTRSTSGARSGTATAGSS